MKIILISCAIGLLGYVFGYLWKSNNPTREEYDGLVYVVYPIIAILFIVMGILL